MLDVVTDENLEADLEHFEWLSIRHLPVGPGWERFVDCVFSLANFQEMRSGNRRPKLSFRDHLKVVAWNLYDAYTADETLWLAVKSGHGDYPVKDVFANSLGVSSRVIEAYRMLQRLRLIEVYPGYCVRDPGYLGKSRCTRIRATRHLIKLIEQNLGDADSVHFNKDRRRVVLRQKFVETKRTKTGRERSKLVSRNVMFDATPETKRLEREIVAYQDVLDAHEISVSDAVRDVVYWVPKQKKKKNARPQPPFCRKNISKRNTFVYRVFNEGSFEKGGRYYGPWWQQIPKDRRAKITIDGVETVELDYSGLHIALIYAGIGLEPPEDPYALQEIVLPGVKDVHDQRDHIKTLVLAAINATSFNDTCRGFRGSAYDKDSAVRSAKNADLKYALDKVVDLYPELNKYLCSNRGIDLMFQDSEIARDVINHFTSKQKPVLSVHDSFIVKQEDEQELFKVMDDTIKSRFKRSVQIKKK